MSITEKSGTYIIKSFKSKGIFVRSLMMGLIAANNIPQVTTDPSEHWIFISRCSRDETLLWMFLM